MFQDYKKAEWLQIEACCYLPLLFHPKKQPKVLVKIQTIYTNYLHRLFLWRINGDHSKNLHHFLDSPCWHHHPKVHQIQLCLGKTAKLRTFYNFTFSTLRLHHIQGLSLLLLGRMNGDHPTNLCLGDPNYYGSLPPEAFICLGSQECNDHDVTRPVWIEQTSLTNPGLDKEPFYNFTLETFRLRHF